MGVRHRVHRMGADSRVDDRAVATLLNSLESIGLSTLVL